MRGYGYWALAWEWVYACVLRGSGAGERVKAKRSEVTYHRFTARSR
jgi:hypothetical protein